MTTRKIIDIEHNGEKVWPKGHAKATFLSDGSTVEDVINNIQKGEGGITTETDPIFSASSSAKITDENISSWNNKVDKVDGKQLSTEDFTTLLKQKLDGLSNYDDTEIQEAVSKLRTDFDTLVSGDTTTAIKTFNEVIAFLDGISDTEDLSGIIASIEQQIAAKQETLVSGSNIKTINGESILGSGDIVIEGGGSSSGGNYPVVISNSTVIVANPNTYYIIDDEADSIEWTFGEPIDGVVNEYILQFKVIETILGQEADSISVTMPDYVVWANNDIPTFALGKTYIISVVNNLACYAEF